MPARPLTQMEAAGRRIRLKRLRRWVMGFVYGVPLLLLVCALYSLFGPKPPPPPVVQTVSATQAAQAQQNIDAVRQALTAPESVAPTAVTPPPTAAAVPSPSSEATAPASGPPPAVHTAPTPSAPGVVQRRRGPDGSDTYTLRVSQADLNAYFAGNKKLKQKLEAKGVHAVSIELHAPDDVTVHANATLQGVTSNALVEATLTPDPKTGLRLSISDARFGLLPPPVVKAAADRIADQIFGHAKTALPLTVQTAEVQGTDLVLMGVRYAPSPAQTPSLQKR